MTEDPALVLLPGLLCDAPLWQAQMDALHSRVPVMLGDLTVADSMEGLAEAVLAAAPPRFALAALSMGGYVAFEILRRAPDRVTRLAFLDTSARADSEAQIRHRRGLIAQSRTGTFKGVTPRVLPQILHPDHVETRIGAVVMEMAQRIGREAYIRQETAILGRPDARADLPHIRKPTLVLAGEADRMTPPHIVCEIAEGIPGAEFRLIPRAGHLPPLEQPDAVTTALAAWLGL